MNETLSVHRCPQCGAPASARPKKCEYCEAEFVVTSLASLGSFGKVGLQKYVAHYNEGLKAEPDKAEIHQAKGICFLELGMFEFAAKSLDRAIELNPENPDTYYYRAVAVVKGRKPRLLSLTELKAVDENLAAAAQLNIARATCHYLRLIVRADYFQRNGLKLPPPTMDELLAKAQSLPYDAHELQKLLALVPVPDGPALAYVPA